MRINKNYENTVLRKSLDSLLSALNGMNNGSITIIKQDNTIIQINVNEKFSIN